MKVAAHLEPARKPDAADLHRLEAGRPDQPLGLRGGAVIAGALIGLRALGEQYLTDTTVYRSGKPFFIDKMPNNFRHLGLIHLILPNPRILDARREPMACCFSNFTQLFAAGQ